MKNFNKFWRKLSGHNGLDVCRLSVFYLKKCIFHSLSKINFRNCQGRKKRVCLSTFGHAYKFWSNLECLLTQKPFVQFLIDLSCITTCDDLLVMLSRVARIKFGWNFASNIKLFFLKFSRYPVIELSIGRPLSHKKWPKNQDNLLNTLRDIKELVMTKLSRSLYHTIPYFGKISLFLQLVVFIDWM